MNRFDGHTFKMYRHDPRDSTSISGNSTWTLCEDKYGALWVATLGFGLNELNRRTGKFTRYYYEPSDSTTISNKTIRDIHEDRNGTLWIGADNGLNRVIRPIAAPQSNSSRATGQITFTRHFHSSPSAPIRKRTSTVREDSTGSFWIQFIEGGTAKFDTATKVFSHYEVDPRLPPMFAGIVVISILEDSDRSRWIFSSDGLFRLHQPTNTLTHFTHDPNDPLSVSSNAVNRGFEDASGTVWIVTVDDGICEFDRRRERFLTHRHRENQRYSLTSDLFSMIAEDGARNLWFVSRDNGVSKLTLRARQFRGFTYASSEADKERAMTPILQSKDGGVWVVTYDSLRYFDSSSKSHVWRKNYGLNAMCEGENGILWLASHADGLGEFNQRTGRVSFHKWNPQSTNPDDHMVWAIVKEPSGLLWVGTWYGGLWLFDPKTHTFTKSFRHNPADPFSINSDKVIALLKGNDGYLWVGTNRDGLNKFDPRTEKFVSWRHNPRDSTSISSNYVTTLFEDRDGRLWVGTDLGLNMFDKQRGTFRRFLRGDVTTSNQVWTIVQDKSGNLWLGYDNGGISKLDLRTGQFATYTTEDGLSSNIFQSSFVREDGEIVMGGSHGIVAFHPDSIRPSTFMPPIALTAFSVFDRNVNLPITLDGYDPITMPYDSNFFSFEFASLDLTVPTRNQHAYKLEGYEKDWNYIGNKREAHYTKVPPGGYVFRVKGTNSDGVWSTKEASIKIVITPPWWRTTWAYLGYALIAGFVFYSARRYDLNRVTLKHRAEVEELRVRKLLEIDQMKSRFFANISHEFRTPLTLILGPIKKWQERGHPERTLSERSEPKEESKDAQRDATSEHASTPSRLDPSTEAQDDGTALSMTRESELYNDLGMMERNAQRLLRLINQLLDLSKLEAGGMKLQASKQNVVSFVKGIARSFESSAGRQAITLAVEADAEEIEMYFDRDRLQKVIVNLLSNAFKFTPEGGRVAVSLRRDVQSSTSLSTRLNVLTDWLVMTVVDTGIGIPKDQLDRVFDRFYQVDASQKREQEGSGIGLALTKELIELHCGSILVTSEEGRGTTFTVRLPLGREHLKDDEVVFENRMGEGAKGREGEAFELSDLPLSHSPTLPFSHSPALPLLPIVGDDKQSPAAASEQPAPLVLIIEDNADVRAYIKDSLSPTYRFEEARDGVEGINKATELIPDLIISDLMMPKMDGNEVCRRLKQNETTSHIPIILLTAKAGQENKLEGLETGADDYLTKPFDAKELLVRVKNLIELRRKLREKFNVGKVLKPGEIAVTSMDDQFLQKAIAIVEKKMGDENFSVEEFAEEVGMSRSQLHRKLTALTNQAPSDFIRYMRLHRAKELLEKNTGTVSEIAFAVGFTSVAYFSK